MGCEDWRKNAKKPSTLLIELLLAVQQMNFIGDLQDYANKCLGNDGNKSSYSMDESKYKHGVNEGNKWPFALDSNWKYQYEFMLQIIVL